jgi:hypothetical protein
MAKKPRPCWKCGCKDIEIGDHNYSAFNVGWAAFRKGAQNTGRRGGSEMQWFKRFWCRVFGHRWVYGSRLVGSNTWRDDDYWVGYRRCSWCGVEEPAPAYGVHPLEGAEKWG